MAEFDENVQVDAAESTATETTNTETVDTEPQEAPEVPPELEGIDDPELVKEIVAEAKNIPAEEAEAEPKQETQKSDITTIPYPRFKEVMDEGKAKDAEIADLKKQIEAYKARQVQAPQAPPPQYQPPRAPQARPQMANPAPFQLTPENVQLINNAITEQAQAMAQLSKEDMDSLEYMEDDDPRKQRWEYAKEMARGNIFSRIREAQQAKLAQAQRFMQAHQQSVNDFNAYAQSQAKEADFEAVKDYAINEFFTNLPSQRDKEIITQAYARVEQNVASPEDMFLIKNYFAQAKAAYRANASAKPQKQTNSKEQTVFPRSTQVNGSGDASGGVTIATLEKMLNEMPFDEIDPKYQKMLLGE